MTQEAITEQTGDATQRRSRSPAKAFPLMKFEDILPLPKSILEHSVDGEMQRLTLFEKLERPPDSSLSRSLVTCSSRYGLTLGSYAAPTISLTEDGRLAMSFEEFPRESKEKQFHLAIAQFEPFNKVYEKLKGRRLPDNAVLKDEFGRVQIAEPDRGKAAEIFTENLRFLGLVSDVSGSDYVNPIEQALQGLPKNANNSLPELPSVEPSAEATVSVEGNRKATEATNRPALHIDIQVHIDPASSGELIDQIFASMAKHLYRYES